MKVHTLNSIYEIDCQHRRVRRIEGDGVPTPRFAPHGIWKPYVEILQCEVGKPLVIEWPDGQPELRDLTVSSTVLALEEPWLSEVSET